MTREELRDYVDEQRGLNNIPYHVYSTLIDGIDTLEQESQSFEWCETCKEYDQEKHCCHRWTKVIRNTVEEMKQEYIEREVLDDLRAEVETEKLEDSPNFCIKAHNIAIDRVLGIIDKYKAEAEG